MERNIYHILAVLFLVGIITSNCKKDDSSTGSMDCQSRTGNSMEAEIDGSAVCTDIGTALVLNIDGSRLSIVGYLINANPVSSITLNIDNPGIGTFDLTEGQYDVDDESTIYIVDKELNEGSGKVTIVEFKDTHVTGTFEFTAIGVDLSTDQPIGKQITVTNGTFYFGLENSYF